MVEYDYIHCAIVPIRINGFIVPNENVRATKEHMSILRGVLKRKPIILTTFMTT